MRGKLPFWDLILGVFEKIMTLGDNSFLVAIRSSTITDTGILVEYISQVRITRDPPEHCRPWWSSPYRRDPQWSQKVGEE